MTIFTLMAGVALAAFVFAATLWSGVQVFMSVGLARLAHGGCAALAALIMASLSLSALIPLKIFGGLLIFAAILALYEAPGWSKLLPFVHLILGAIALSGMPLEPVGGL